MIWVIPSRTNLPGPAAAPGRVPTHVGTVAFADTAMRVSYLPFSAVSGVLGSISEQSGAVTPQLQWVTDAFTDALRGRADRRLAGRAVRLATSDARGPEGDRDRQRSRVGGRRRGGHRRGSMGCGWDRQSPASVPDWSCQRPLASSRPPPQLPRRERTRSRFGGGQRRRAGRRFFPSGAISEALPGAGAWRGVASDLRAHRRAGGRR